MPLAARLPGALVALATALFAVVCASFAHQPGLASFADDSVSYLVMAQVFSPWQPASAAVAGAFAGEAFYPPLYPLFLAAAGAAHDIALAHVATALLLAACLPLQYLLGVRWLGERWAAAAAVGSTALLPSLWINVKGILSEPLFMLLMLAVLIVLERGASTRMRVALGILLAALALTRAVGLAMAGGYALAVLLQRGPTARARVLDLVPVAAAFAAYGAWFALRPAGTHDEYARVIADGLTTRLAAQTHAIAEAWIGALMLFWVDTRLAPTLLAGAIGALALAGLVLRLRERRPDAWMSAAYLSVFLVWPFPGQMTRFLFPLLPVLVLYAFYALAAAMRAARRPAFVAWTVLALTFCSLAVPALGFVRERARLGAGVGYAAITDWYRYPDLREAARRAAVHLDLFADMAVIASLTRADERVMWTVPVYVALLAGRPGARAPDAALGADAYLEAVRRSGAEYVFLSRYHPRETTSDAAWQAGVRALTHQAKVLHARARPDGTVTALLMAAPR